jgi:RNA polymerase sigma-70 factor (ECF subfamily)
MGGFPFTRASLLSRVRDPADHRAWEEFSRQYSELILRFCLRQGLQHTDAEDVRQIVLFSVVKSMRGGSFTYAPARGRFRDYLGATVRHAIFRYMSGHGRGRSELSVEELAEEPPHVVDPDPVWEREWMDHHLRMAMQGLNRMLEPSSVEVFRRILAGEETSEIATALSMTPEAVRKVKQRAMDRLRELVAEQVEAEDTSDE